MSTATFSRISRLACAGLLIALALLLAACGGDSDTDEIPTDRPDSDSPEPPAAEPVPGGGVVFGLEAETNGWDPTAAQWAAGGRQVALSIYDPLAADTPDGDWAPYLAESIVPNDDYTQWTIRLRPGVRFHNGEPLTSADVKRVFDEHLASPLTGTVFALVDSVEVVDDLTVRVDMSAPWSVFPSALTTQVGVIPAAEQLDGDDRSTVPIGTGPFVFDEWVPDTHLRVVRNDDYWREGLPYLDEIEYRVIADNDQRGNAFSAGDVDMLHTTDAALTVDLRERADAGDAQLVEDQVTSEQAFLQLNLAKPPFDDVRVRTALAQAIDQEAYLQVVSDGVLQPVLAPFSTESRWHSDQADDAYPSFDPEAAASLVDEYEAEAGPARIRLGIASGTQAQRGMPFLAESLESVGFDVEIVEAEFSQYVLQTVTGDYDANVFRRFGTPDPDSSSIAWGCANVQPIGQVSVNISRYCSDAVDVGLAAGRATEDFDERYEAYESVQKQLNEDVVYGWLNTTIWSLGAEESVQNLAVATLPDGGDGVGFIQGRTPMAEVWIEP